MSFRTEHVTGVAKEFWSVGWKKTCRHPRAIHTTKDEIISMKMSANLKWKENWVPIHWDWSTKLEEWNTKWRVGGSGRYEMLPGTDCQCLYFECREKLEDKKNMLTILGEHRERSFYLPLMESQSLHRLSSPCYIGIFLVNKGENTVSS